MPLENIQRTLGHKDLDTTLIYARVSDKKTADLIEESFSHPLRLVNKESVLNSTVSNTNYNTVNAVQVNQSSENPITIAQRRFASGEIDLTEFQFISKNLMGSNTSEVLSK
jgi:hypothetical protein